MDDHLPMFEKYLTAYQTMVECKSPTGMDTEVLSGGHYVTVAGISKHTVNKDDNGAGGDINISAQRNMTTDVTQTYRVTAKTIFLN